VTTDAALLWKTGDELLEQFNSPQRLEELHDDNYQPERFPLDLLKSATPDNALQAFEGSLLPLDPRERIYLNITGFIHPLRLDDSHALVFNVRRPERGVTGNQTEDLDLAWLSRFHPNQCFSPAKIGRNSVNFLGQTILITGWLTEEQLQTSPSPQDLRTLADQCVAKFFAETDNRPSLYQAGQLLGSPMFEYSTFSSAALNRWHLLVWLFQSPESERQWINCYRELVQLFFYRNKILRLYQERGRLYGELYPKYQRIVQDLDQLNLLSNNLAGLKTKLNDSLLLAGQYTALLGSLQHQANTISINTRNYGKTVEDIQRQTTTADLSILRTFCDKQGALFKEQINADLGYFALGSNLLDKTLATIRGIVQIQQTQIDLQRQGQEKRLEGQIQALGIGIGTGAIVASSSGLLTASESMWGNPPMLIAIVISSACALLGWGLTRWWLQRVPTN